ncbi:hypothetical protein DERP_012688 [Dermatophagoides pteronyssinus]|uniref:Uncharacterized protein n=1 Tax=Dermatophagoides pteronyssinus TaxID=6956 RepID=A0ABQ8IYW7_DERPT|nr:hypothetical protein DERP_012688 [Dermatophagoides pteronyssinus]
MIKWQSIALLVLVALASSIRARTSPMVDSIYVPPAPSDVVNDESRNLQQLINQLVSHMQENPQNHPHPKITNVNINKIYSPACSPCGKNDKNCDRSLQQSVSGLKCFDEICDALRTISQGMVEMEQQLCDGNNNAFLIIPCKLFTMVNRYMKELTNTICNLKQQQARQLQNNAKPFRQQRNPNINALTKYKRDKSNSCQQTMDKYEMNAKLWYSKCSKSNSFGCEKIEEKITDLMQEYVDNCDQTCSHTHRNILSVWQDKLDQCRMNDVCVNDPESFVCKEVSNELELLMGFFKFGCDPKCDRLRHGMLAYWQDLYQQCMKTSTDKLECAPFEWLIENLERLLEKICQPDKPDRRGSIY